MIPGCLARPTMEGKTLRGASSPAKPGEVLTGGLLQGLGFELLCHDIVSFLLRNVQNSVLNSPALHIPDPLSITRAVCYSVNIRSCF